MELVFSHENLMIVTNMKNILEQHRIEVLLKNEFASGGMGELPVFDTWAEIWVIDENQFSIAQHLVKEAQQRQGDSDWFCQQCKEPNDPSFEFCWHCQYPAPAINNS
ncbi:DUF2007 domain-containing protein [Thalassotalea euphylliae]|uniref:putative signal transducing protein n=1 Tax=Thalassotalea euphylliae TaxID=1655234 RepID=UPI00362D864F